MQTSYAGKRASDGSRVVTHGVHGCVYMKTVCAVIEYILEQYASL